ncbi:nucleotidyl transferase AbiEii/AbiGii toxin family protein [Paludibaculum fermentans]|uniref:Nucleotidyl transferase AbiEii/AbiGii toxin family protein n=1 Tax=Paludibaculum fermentans TaxID=1473598 RepID=A0A7S7NRV9_PALFE|nr:nucleotidyl transferase AbiEii/AbiGii toxin family protein [Paludibaculum fermentans]QOY88534.1 nucleotidyl transferase AbiEii/AbiGii toxin family protein [Paludibaculum fermentans]
MTTSRQYNSGAALRTSLEERLKRSAHEEAVDLQRLRRQVAFDRFLARLFQDRQTDWVLKGGYAMELRFHAARATKDLDFTVRAKSSGVLGYLQEAGALDIGDFFSFRIGEATMDLDGAPYGGARYPVEAILGSRTFVKFHLDVGVGDIIVEPLEFVRTRDWLAFAGVPPPDVPMIQREQQFAEKLHAYTLPRPAAPNSRVRDLVDLVLLIRSGTLEQTRVVGSLRETFARRDTHQIPRKLEAPPESWVAPFAALAEECSLDVSVSEAFSDLTRYFDGLEEVNL